MNILTDLPDTEIKSRTVFNNLEQQYEVCIVFKFKKYHISSTYIFDEHGEYKEALGCFKKIDKN